MRTAVKLFQNGDNFYYFGMAATANAVLKDFITGVVHFRVLNVYT
jgi:hypothetical protein